MRSLILLLSFVCTSLLAAQTGVLRGKITDASGTPVAFASIGLADGSKGVLATENGTYEIAAIPAGEQRFLVSALGFAATEFTVIIRSGATTSRTITMEATSENLEAVVVTGTMKPVSKTASPGPVEVYTANFFRANPTPSVCKR